MSKLRKIVFLILFFLILVVPTLCTDTTPDKVSMLDNRNLTTWPADWYRNWSSVEQYVCDRIGFRENIITLYQYTDYYLYGELNHPLYMIGKEGWIFTKEWDSINYQHLDEDEEYIKSTTDFIEYLGSYCESKGIRFCFFMAADKESVYPEYYPNGYNIETRPNRTDVIVDTLKRDGVNCIDSRQALIQAKDRGILVYNKKQDAGHWNQNGAFVGVEDLYKKFLYEEFPQNGMLNIDEFDLDLNYEEYLINSLFRIDEFVPAYEIKNENFEDLSDDFQRNHNVTNWAFDKVNDKCNKKILIFCDSYFGSSHVDKFFINHYGEVIMIHYANLKDLNSYVEEYNPDVIIIETAERAFNRNGGRSDSFQWTQEWYSKVLTTT